MSEPRISRAIGDRIAVAEAVLEATPNGVLVLDLEHRVLANNSRLLTMCGLSAEALGAGGAAGVDAALEPLLLEVPPPLSALPTNPSPEPERIHTLRFKDGRHYERHVTDCVVDGRLMGFVVVFNDITHLRQTEEALARDRAFLEKAQEVARIGSWTLDLGGDGNLEWSAEMYRISGFPPGTTISRAQALTEMVHPDDRDLVLRARNESRASGQPYSIEHRILRPDGSTRWVQTRGDVVRAADGRPLRVVGTVQDITDRYALEEQLRHAQRLEGLGRLAGGVAHDLNNALNVITGYTEVLLEEITGDSRALADLGEIRRATERAAATVRQLLAFSRKQQASRRVFHIEESIASLRSLIERLFGPEISISLQAAADLPPISGDPGQIEQALFNLATNAKDAMPQGGQLRFVIDQVRLDAAAASRHQELKPGHYVTVQVSDTGHGMTPEVMSRIFDPFFTTKDVGQGTGLGLSMVYGTVQQSGGAILVESSPGVGTTFRLYFPVAEESGLAAPAPALATAGEATILVVDDEPASCQLAASTLGRAGYRVLLATSGVDAIDIARQQPRVDVLLTDLRMPGVHGRQLAQAVRAIHPDVQVVLMSGFVSDLPKGLAGAQRLEKPFTQSALRDAVQGALGSSVRQKPT